MILCVTHIAYSVVIVDDEQVQQTEATCLFQRTMMSMEWN